MNVINCSWELANLDRRVVELSLYNHEIIDKEAFSKLECDYDYIVVKTQTNELVQYKDLSAMGYSFVESQITVRKDFENLENKSDFISSNVKDLYESMKCIRVTNEKDLNHVLVSMTKGMFVTDRIYLDDSFEKRYSLQRYRNWTRTEFFRGTQLYNIIYGGVDVGFLLFKLFDARMNVLLWGLYEQFQHHGFGNLVPLSVYYINDKIEHFKSFETKVSSNNKGIIDKLNHLGFIF